MTSRLLEAFEQFLNDDGTPIADGQLRFLVAGSTGTTALQDTFSDINLQNANPNPLPIQASGRIPAVWSQDIYFRIRYERTDGTLIKEVDYVGTPESEGQLGAWNNELVYTVDRIVYYSGKFYRSNVNGNQDNQPDISSQWSELDFPEKYLADVTYGLNKLVYDGGILYVSAQAANTGNTPATSPNWWQRLNNVPVWGSTTTYRHYDLAIDSNGVVVVSQQNNNLNHNPVGDTTYTWWKPLSRVFVDEQPQLFQANRMAGGGTLKAEWNNIITDGNAGYIIPLANTVPADTQMMVSKADTARTLYPILTCSGSDLLDWLGGTDNQTQIDTQWADSFILTSNGSNRWRF